MITYLSTEWTENIKLSRKNSYQWDNFLTKNMEEELVSEIGNKFQIIYLLVLDKGHILNCLKLVRQNEVYTERQVEFQNGEPD